MHVLRGAPLDCEEIRQYAEARAHTKGIIGRVRLEEIVSVRSGIRPFASIRFSDSKEFHSYFTLVDEQMAPAVDSETGFFLIWRPRYVELVPGSVWPRAGLCDLAEDSQRLATSMATRLLKIRKEAQENLEKIGPQLDPYRDAARTISSLLIPRGPTSVMKMEELSQARARNYAKLAATSLVSNSTNDVLLERAQVGPDFGVETATAVLRNSRTGELRIMAFETPGTASVDEAATAGRPLSLLCEAKPSCTSVLIRNLTEEVPQK